MFLIFYPSAAGDQGPGRLHVPALHCRGGRGHRLRSLRRLLRSGLHVEVVRQDVLRSVDLWIKGSVKSSAFLLRRDASSPLPSAPFITAPFIHGDCDIFSKNPNKPNKDFFTRIKHELSENGWAELKILSLSIIPHLSSLK